MGGVGAPAEMGLAPRRSPRPDAASLRRLYVEEVVTQTAHNWLVADVPRRAPPETVRVDVSDVEVRRLYALEGWTAAEVAAHLRCGTSTVYAHLQGLAWPGGRRGPGAAPGPRTPSSGACTSKTALASASSPSGSR